MININLYSLTGFLNQNFNKDEYKHTNNLVKIYLPPLPSGNYIIKTETNGDVQIRLLLSTNDSRTAKIASLTSKNKPKRVIDLMIQLPSWV